jgi:hypothetical protein
MLVMWPIAVALVYFFGPHFSPHALTGVTLPLAVLAVRGWSDVAARLRMPAPILGALAAVGALAVFTVPSVISHAQSVSDDLAPTIGGAVAQAQLRLTADEAAALAYVDHARRPGGVIAPPLLSLSVPAFTGRQTFVGHHSWEPADRQSVADEFFNPSLPEPRAKAVRTAILRASRAVFVVAECGTAPTFSGDIASAARLRKRFGCVTVYEVS